MISFSGLVGGAVHIPRARYVISSKGVWLPVWLLFILVLSCRQGTDIQKENLFGKWDVVKAIRNGNETPYLRGGYFIIESNGTMTVNITGSDEKGPFTLEDRTLRTYNAKEFSIQSIHADSMALRFMPGTGNEFVFFLEKNKNEIH